MTPAKRSSAKPRAAAGARNPGEGVPKETPRRHSLDALENAAGSVLNALSATKLREDLVKSGYFDASLMEQFRMAADALFRACAERRRAPLFEALLNHASERIRAYAAPLAFFCWSENLDQCAGLLLRVGTAEGTSPQEIAQMYLKRLAVLHGVRPVARRCVSWLNDPNPAARRLLVEALRPRGVWTGHLTELRGDPAPLKPILEAVLDDPSEYVRKAAANCLNDIAKDHPDVVCQWVDEWRCGAVSPERAFIIKRGLRTLLKDAHPKALAATGFGDTGLLRVTWTNRIPKTMSPGDYIEVVLDIENPSSKRIAVRAQLELVGPGAGAKLRKRVYHLAEVVASVKCVTPLVRRIRFADRNSQPKLKGRYTVNITLNGVAVSSQEFAYR